SVDPCPRRGRRGPRARRRGRRHPRHPGDRAREARRAQASVDRAGMARGAADLAVNRAAGTRTRRHGRGRAAAGAPAPERRDTVPGMTSATDRWWDCPLDVETFACDAVDRARDAAAHLARARGLDVHVDTSPALIGASFAAYDHLRVDGEGVETWAELSGFVRAADGWVRLHGNFPHHAAALRELYGIRDRAGLESVLARRRAADIE